MRLPFVDVIIPHLNDHARLVQCLELLRGQSYPADSFSVTVVDNGSDRPIDDLAARFGARVGFEAVKGCGSARNRGVAESAGNILAFTDSDCRPEPDWLLNGVRHLEDGTGVDIVAGNIKVFAQDEAAPTDAELYDKVFGFEAKRYAQRKHFATGANIMVPRRVFEAVGPFRDGRLPEDLEWGRRATKLGYRIAFAPDVMIRHPARHDMDELRRKVERTVWHARNHMAEHRMFRARWALYTLAMASPPLMKAWQIMASRELKDWPQRRRTLATLAAIRSFRAGIMARYLFAPLDGP